MFAVCRRQGEPQYSMMNIASHIFGKYFVRGILNKEKDVCITVVGWLCF